MDQSAEIQPDPKVDAIIANITQLMDEAEQMLRDSTSQHAEQQIELLRTRCDNVQTSLAAFCASAGRAISAGARRTDRTIRAHPYESLAVALGAGVLFGMGLARRNS